MNMYYCVLTKKQYEKWLANPTDRKGFYWRDDMRERAMDKAREEGMDKVIILSPEGEELDFFM